MLSPLLNTMGAFFFTAFITGWIAALVIDRCCGRDGMSPRGLALILFFALIAGSVAGTISWQQGEFQRDQTLEMDYELNH